MPAVFSQKIAISIALGAALSGLLTGCDRGLSPEPTSPSGSGAHGISGSVVFTNWPPRDSVLDLRLVCFKNRPSSSIVSDILNGKAKYTGTLQPYGADTVVYTLLLDPLPPGQYALTGVAQQYGTNLYTDWRLVGLYYREGDSAAPGVLTVPADSIVRGITVHVDFRHLPPLP